MHLSGKGNRSPESIGATLTTATTRHTTCILSSLDAKYRSPPCTSSGTIHRDTYHRKQEAPSPASPCQFLLKPVAVLLNDLSFCYQAASSNCPFDPPSRLPLESRRNDRKVCTKCAPECNKGRGTLPCYRGSCRSGQAKLTGRAATCGPRSSSRRSELPLPPSRRGSEGRWAR
jgi:hypothetical protein